MRRSSVCKVVLLVAISAFAASADVPAAGEGRFGDQSARIEEHLGQLLQASCAKYEARYELQKVFDLLVVWQMEHPSGPAALPLPDSLTIPMGKAPVASPECEDSMAKGLFAALRGDLAAATLLISHRDITFGCGNAMDAERFGIAEALKVTAFLTGHDEEAAGFRLPQTIAGLADINIRSSRWALDYGMRAVANERLGRLGMAVSDSCWAAREAEHYQSSWGGCYPADSAIWQEITSAIQTLRQRLGGECTPGM